MRLNLYTIRAKLVVAFSLLLLISIVFITLFILFSQKINRINNSLEHLRDLQVKTQLLGKLEKTFFKDETFNTAFYQKKQSPYIQKIDSLLKYIVQGLENLKEDKDLLSTETAQKIDTLAHNFNLYKQTLDSIVILTLKRGFEDYGLEGEMRDDIHFIEEVPALDLGKVLMVRRREKDFFLRKDAKYIRLLAKDVEVLQQEIRLKITDPVALEKLSTSLERYYQVFLQIEALERQIGFKDNEGLRKKMAEYTYKIDKLVYEISITLQEEAQKQQARVTTSLISIASFSLLLIITLSVYFTRILSKPIQKLSSSIYKVIKHNFAEGIEVQVIKTRDEIGRLSEDFSYMLEEVRGSLAKIRHKSEQLEKQQKQITDSIRYAEQIQTAILPTEQELKEVFEEHFILFRPRDLVSGDFYWIPEEDIRRRVREEIREQGKFINKEYVAVVDCTGHGVPGAFMSLIGHTLLNKVLRENITEDPAFLLEMLHMDILLALHQEIKGYERQRKDLATDDGMDLVLCQIETPAIAPHKRKITFAGAKRPLFYTHKGELHTLSGTKRSIGGGTGNKTYKPFENETVTLEQGDVLYMITDGFVDQPTPKRKKYGTKHLLQLLDKIKALPLTEQKELIENEFKKCNVTHGKQRDDITFVVIRL